MSNEELWNLIEKWDRKTSQNKKEEITTDSILKTEDCEDWTPERNKRTDGMRHTNANSLSLCSCVNSEHTKTSWFSHIKDTLYTVHRTPYAFILFYFMVSKPCVFNVSHVWIEIPHKLHSRRHKNTYWHKAGLTSGYDNVHCASNNEQLYV